MPSIFIHCDSRLLLERNKVKCKIISLGIYAADTVSLNNSQLKLSL